LVALGQTRDAEAAFHACLTIDPDAVGAHRGLVALYGGALYDPRRQRQHAARVQEIRLVRQRGDWDEATAD
jgi:hypothetical protein